jgi:hypothetical protein
VPVSEFRIQEVREVRPKAMARGPEPRVPERAESSDQRLAEEVFGPGGAAMGVEFRLQRLVAWLVAETGASSAFVADLEGLPLLNLNTPEAYVVAIAPLARAQAEIAHFVPDSPPGTSIVELDQQNVLEVVWADTTVGRLGVGLVTADPLKHTLISRIRRAVALSVVSRGGT